MLIQLITALLGALGFALIFNERKKLMPFACLGGLLAWGAYLGFAALGCGVFSAVLQASALAALYSELLARRLKLPSTVLFIPSAVPLVPGGSLYYTMQAAVYGDRAALALRGSETLSWAIAIALGMSLVRAYFGAESRLKKQRSSKKSAS